MLLKAGHFHFGRNRTFSLWLDIGEERSCFFNIEVIVSPGAFFQSMRGGPRESDSRIRCKIYD